MYFNNVKAFSNFPCHIYTFPWRQSSKDWKHFTNITANKQMTYSRFQTFAMFWILYSFFWVIPQHPNSMRRHFRTLSTFIGWNCQSVLKHLHTKLTTPGNHPKERIQITYYILKFTVMVFHSLMLNPWLLKAIVFYCMNQGSIHYFIFKKSLYDCWTLMAWSALTCTLLWLCVSKFVLKYQLYLYVCVSYFLIRRLYLYLPVVVTLI
jgi:hypothetical protein